MYLLTHLLHWSGIYILYHPYHSFPLIWTVPEFVLHKWSMWQPLQRKFILNTDSMPQTKNKKSNLHEICYIRSVKAVSI